MNTCPLCGYQGEQTRCPNDGEELLSAEVLAARAPNPTKAPDNDATRVEGLSDDDAALRGEDFGQWAAPSVPAPRPDPMIGRTISGRYEVTGLLGKGGMGAVYKAWQPAVQRDIALKVLLQEFTENEVVIKRFHQEALAASRLTHPNTIKVYDFGQSEDGILYIAMEYLRGQSLAELMAKTPKLPQRRAVHIMRQVCKSLSEAHKAGIIHRDLKPDNIFLTDIEGEEDFIKVLDFGVAKLKEYEGKEGTLTQAGMIFGTPKYMSPEQARSGDLDARSDVYALGVVLYHMLVGRPPFLGDNPLSILIAHVNEAPAPFAAWGCRDVLKSLEAVVFKALEKRVEDRQRDVDELLNQLNAVLALFDGANLQSVSGILPPLPTDHTGRIDILGLGAAIIPAGTDDTVNPGQASDTVVLSEEAPAPLGVADVLLTAQGLPVQRPTQGVSSKWLALLAVPILAGAAFAIFGGESKPNQAPVAAIAPMPVTAVDATTPPMDATIPVDATPTPDAAPTVDAAKPAQTWQFAVGSRPSRARIYNVATDEKIGATLMMVSISKETTYELRKSGYTSRRFTLKPNDAETAKRFTLKPIAGPAKPKPVVVKTPTTPPTKPIVVRPPPIKVPATPIDDVPIDLQ